MTSKLYLIESEESDGLVKIGFTAQENAIDGDAVYARVKQYKTGISHSATVHETSGADIFERYFHNFFGKYRKPVQIKFKLTGNETYPKEWFSLSPEVSSHLIEAFSQEHPTEVDQIPLEDLPVFLSGAFSAIHWHAQNATLVNITQTGVNEDDFASEDSAADESVIEETEPVSPYINPAHDFWFRNVSDSHSENPQQTRLESIDVSSDSEQNLDWLQRLVIEVVTKREFWLGFGLGVIFPLCCLIFFMTNMASDGIAVEEDEMVVLVETPMIETTPTQIIDLVEVEYQIEVVSGITSSVATIQSGQSTVDLWYTIESNVTKQMDDEEIEHALPFAEIVELASGTYVELAGVLSGDRQGKIACRILVNGLVVSARTSYGSGAGVYCGGVVP